MPSAFYVNWWTRHYFEKNDKLSGVNADERGFLKIFTTAMIERQKKVALDLVKQTFEKKFVQPNIAKMSEIKSIKNKEVAREEYLNLVRDVQEQALPQAAATMVKELQMVPWDKIDTENPNLNVVIQNLQVFIDKVRKTLKKVESDFKKPETITALISDKELNALVSGNTQVSSELSTETNAFRRKLREDIMGSEEFSIDLKGKYKNGVDSYLKTVAMVEANLIILESFKTEDNLKNLPVKVRSTMMQQLIGSTWAMLNRNIIGFMSEERLSTALVNSKKVKEAINQSLSKNNKNQNGVTITGTFESAVTGAESSLVFSKKTSDVSLDINIEKMIDGESIGTFSVSFPSVSLKRTFVKQGKRQSINLKTDTKLGHFFEIKQAFGETNKKRQDMLQEAFYNAFAKYKAKRNEKNEVISAKVSEKKANKDRIIYDDEMTAVYKWFRYLALVPALTGSQNKDDFAFFFVVNDKVYTADKIVAKVIQDDGKKGGLNLSHNLPNLQRQLITLHKRVPAERDGNIWTPDKHSANIRSNNIIEAIRGLLIAIKLNANFNTLDFSGIEGIL